MLRHIRQVLNETTSAGHLALFRIAYSLVLFCEVWELLRFRHLIFDPIPYIAPGEISFGPLLLAWMVAIAMLAVGFKTRIAAVANYCFTLTTFSTFSAFEYHIDYIYTATNLLLVFAPVANCLSIDAWLLTRRTGKRPSFAVGRVYRDAILFCSVGLVYFDSVLYKFGSDIWQYGLGVWLPASYPHATWNPNLTWLLDNRSLVTALSHLTLLFELLFVFLFWFKRCHSILLIVGLGLHIGITAVFPIPWFGATMIAFYCLLLPDRIVEWIARRTPQEQLTEEISDRHCRHSVTFIAAASLLFQIPSLVTSPTAFGIARGARLTAAWAPFARLFTPYTKLARPFLGTTPHTVFLDFHFRGYDHELAILHIDPQSKKKTWLPLISESGTTRSYNTGRMWAYWSFRVCGPQLDTKTVRKGITRITAFWAIQHGLQLKGSRFQILVREYDRPLGWEPGFATRQLAKPWSVAGELEWHGNGTRFSFDNPDSEIRSPAETAYHD